MDDGYATTINVGGTLFYEKVVTPPGVDGGGPIDITLMANTKWRTFAAKALMTLANASATVAYDPACYDEIIDLVNVNGSIVVTFPDTHTLTFYGWLNSFIPNECAEGGVPTAEIEIIASNQNAGVETAPVYA